MGGVNSFPIPFLCYCCYKVVFVYNIHFWLTLMYIHVCVKQTSCALGLAGAQKCVGQKCQLHQIAGIYRDVYDPFNCSSSYLSPLFSLGPIHFSLFSCPPEQGGPKSTFPDLSWPWIWNSSNCIWDKSKAGGGNKYFPPGEENWIRCRICDQLEWVWLAQCAQCAQCGLPSSNTLWSLGTSFKQAQLHLNRQLT